jgi:hypothetical protein
VKRPEISQQAPRPVEEIRSPASDSHFEDRVVMIEHEDFSVVVKNRANPPKPWRWEIYRAGRESAIDRSVEFFATVGAATRAGNKALQLLLSEYPPP